jgi:hypothetical protein
VPLFPKIGSVYYEEEVYTDYPIPKDLQIYSPIISPKIPRTVVVKFWAKVTEKRPLVYQRIRREEAHINNRLIACVTNTQKDNYGYSANLNLTFRNSSYVYGVDKESDLLLNTDPESDMLNTLTKASTQPANNLPEVPVSISVKKLTPSTVNGYKVERFQSTFEMPPVGEETFSASNRIQLVSRYCFDVKTKALIKTDHSIIRNSKEFPTQSHTRLKRFKLPPKEIKPNLFKPFASKLITDNNWTTYEDTSTSSRDTHLIDILSSAKNLPVFAVPDNPLGLKLSKAERTSLKNGSKTLTFPSFTYDSGARNMVLTISSYQDWRIFITRILDLYKPDIYDLAGLLAFPLGTINTVDGKKAQVFRLSIEHASEGALLIHTSDGDIVIKQDYGYVEPSLDDDNVDLPEHKPFTDEELVLIAKRVQNISGNKRTITMLKNQITEINTSKNASSKSKH